MIVAMSLWVTMSLSLVKSGWDLAILSNLWGYHSTKHIFLLASSATQKSSLSSLRYLAANPFNQVERKWNQVRWTNVWLRWEDSRNGELHATTWVRWWMLEMVWTSVLQVLAATCYPIPCNQDEDPHLSLKDAYGGTGYKFCRFYKRSLLPSPTV